MNSLPKASFLEKIIWTILALLCLSALFFSHTLEPDPRGYGTHESFFIPCGFRQVTGFPCPTCGITTSFAYLSKGKIWQGIRTQPFGGFLFLLSILIPCHTILAWISGRSFFGILKRRMILIFYLICSAFLLSWGFMLLTS